MATRLQRLREDAELVREDGFATFLVSVSLILAVWWVAESVDLDLDWAMKLPIEVALPMFIWGMLAFAVGTARDAAEVDDDGSARRSKRKRRKRRETRV